MSATGARTFEKRSHVWRWVTNTTSVCPAGNQNVHRAREQEQAQEQGISLAESLHGGQSRTQEKQWATVGLAFGEGRTLIRTFPLIMSAAVETINLPHLPPHIFVHAALYRNIQNAGFLRQQLIEGNADFEYALIDASMVGASQYRFANEGKNRLTQATDLVEDPCPLSCLSSCK